MPSSTRGAGKSGRLAAAMLVIAVAAGSAGVQGFHTLEPYDGAKFPTSAGVWTSLFDEDGINHPETFGFNWGPVLEVDGDRLADVSDLERIPDNYDPRPGEFIGAPYPSPSTPDVWCVYGSTRSGPQLDVISHSIARFDRINGKLSYRGEYFLPAEIDNEGTGSPGFRFFIRSWTGIAAIRRTAAGEDAILVTAREASPSGFTLTTKFAVLFLDPNPSPTVARWSEVNDQMNGYELVTMDERGNAIARKIEFDAPSAASLSSET